MSSSSKGWGAGTGVVGDARRSGEFSGARQLLRRLVEVVAEPDGPQQRLDQIVTMIAQNLVAEVCSVYALRAGDILELFATKGLALEAVHHTRMPVGQGLVGTIAAIGAVINTSDARKHVNYRYFPETREEHYSSFLGVPIVRSGRVVGVLTVQNASHRVYNEEEVEAVQIIASVLAEMFASGGIVDRARYGDLPSMVRESRRLEGLRLSEGISIGVAWPHEPRVVVTRLLSDNPKEEWRRVEEAIGSLRSTLDAVLERSDFAKGEHREIFEAYRMFAYDSGWLRRISEAIETGLCAEAAVRRVQDDTRLRMQHATDSYLKERLLDLDDLANRLLRHLVGAQASLQGAPLRDDIVLVARDLTAAELVEYDRRRLKGIVLEEGSRTAHVTIVARAFDIPIVGRIEGAMTLLEQGDLLAIDGDNGVVLARPSEEVLQAFHNTIQSRLESKRALDQVKGLPSITRDGIHIELMMNAAFLADMVELSRSGAEGVGLFRTELAFMARSHAPDSRAQAVFYRKVLEHADRKKVVFRTLDIGSDKQVSYWRMPLEENPAMGWRAIRLTLDRPSVMRVQLRGILQATAGRDLSLVFPMISELAEFERARALLRLELAAAERRGERLPESIELGVMLEVPALYWQLDELLPQIDFLSIGSNDLFQFFFACDRGNPDLAERYDVLSPSALRFVRDIVEKCREHGVTVTFCGEMASRPLEAMALIALGVRHLSVTPSAVSSLKAMVRSIEATSLRRYVLNSLTISTHTLRGWLMDYASDHGVVLPEGFNAQR